jgi:hypothetical protein
MPVDPAHTAIENSEPSEGPALSASSLDFWPTAKPYKLEMSMYCRAKTISNQSQKREDLHLKSIPKEHNNSEISENLFLLKSDNGMYLVIG